MKRSTIIAALAFLSLILGSCDKCNKCEECNGCGGGTPELPNEVKAEWSVCLSNDLFQYVTPVVEYWKNDSLMCMDTLAESDFAWVDSSSVYVSTKEMTFTEETIKLYCKAHYAIKEGVTSSGTATMSHWLACKVTTPATSVSDHTSVTTSPINNIGEYLSNLSQSYNAITIQINHNQVTTSTDTDVTL